MHSTRAVRTLRTALLAPLCAVLWACSGGGNGDSQIAAAKALLVKHDAKAAVIELKNAIQQNPKSAEARLLLGRTLLDMGDATTALVELIKAQELQASDDQVVPDIARALLMSGEEAKLLTQYGSTTLQDASAQADLRTSVATAMAAKGDLDGAGKVIEDALKAKPDFGTALNIKARLAAAAGDLDGALALLDGVLKTRPLDEKAGLLKGEFLLLGKRDGDAAIAAYRKVLEGRDGSVAARAAIANILFQQRKLPEARSEFEALKKLAPEHPETLLLQAQLAFADNDLRTTQELTNRLLKAMPNHARALELAGAAALRAKNHSLAETHLSKVVKGSPTALRPRLLLAQTYLTSGQPEKALDVLQPILDAPNADAVSLSLAGEAYLQTGDGKRSEAAFKRALKAAPDNNTVRTTAALAQLARGEPSGPAIAELESVAGKDTGTRADLALVSARLSQNDPNGALKAIDAIEKKLPDKPLAFLLRGRVLLMKQDLAGAVRSFEAAVGKDPAFFPAVASLAAIDLAAAKPDLARQRFEAYQKANPKNYQVLLALAELDNRTGAPASKVVDTLRAAIKIDPVQAAPHLMLIGKLLSTGDGKGALAAAHEATAALPEQLDIMDALGRAQMAAGDAQAAISTLRKLSSLKPKNTTVLVHLADAYRINKDPATAQTLLRQALDLQPDLVAARSGLIALALQNQRQDQALALAREQQKLSPKDGSGYQFEGEIEASRRNWDAAATAFRTALQRERKGSIAVKLHAALLAGGKAAEADKFAGDWLKDSPRDTAFLFYMGDLAMARKDFSGAAGRYRSVLEANPQDALAMNNLAWMMARQNQPGAVALAEKANALMPDRPALLDTLSVALEAEGQVAKAVDAQARAVKLQPEDGNLALRLAQLYIKTGDKARARAELEGLARPGQKAVDQAEVAKLLKSL